MFLLNIIVLLNIVEMSKQSRKLFLLFKQVLDRGPEQKEPNVTVLYPHIIIILISSIIIKLLIMKNHPSRSRKRNSLLFFHLFRMAYLYDYIEMCSSIHLNFQAHVIWRITFLHDDNFSGCFCKHLHICNLNFFMQVLWNWQLEYVLCKTASWTHALNFNAF